MVVTVEEPGFEMPPNAFVKLPKTTTIRGRAAPTHESDSSDVMHASSNRKNKSDDHKDVLEQRGIAQYGEQRHFGLGDFVLPQDFCAEPFRQGGQLGIECVLSRWLVWDGLAVGLRLHRRRLFSVPHVCASPSRFLLMVNERGVMALLAPLYILVRAASIEGNNTGRISFGRVRKAGKLSDRPIAIPSCSGCKRDRFHVAPSMSHTRFMGFHL